MRSFLQLLVFCASFHQFLGSQELLKPELEGCLKCICEAVTSCDDLVTCATKTISKDYWEKGGALRAKPEDIPGTSATYRSCILNNFCILNTMTNYIDGILNQINDINCDGVIDCRDRLAAHKFGMTAKESTSIFEQGHMKRFDRCQGHGSVNITYSGWEPKICP